MIDQDAESGSSVGAAELEHTPRARRSPATARLRGRGADHRKTFALGGRGQTIVETHEGESCGSAFGCRDARRELQRISSAQLVDTQEAERVFPQHLGRLYFLPRSRKAIEPATCRYRRARSKHALPLEARNR